MVNDSTLFAAADSSVCRTKGPRIATVDFIRQFSRAYVQMNRADRFGGLICN